MEPPARWPDAGCGDPWSDGGPPLWSGTRGLFSGMGMRHEFVKKCGLGGEFRVKASASWTHVGRESS